MKFYVLASGSKGNCVIVKNEDTTVMIDCGSTKKYLTECFKTINLRISDIDGVLITHDHSDHISQIRMFKDRIIYAPVKIKDINSFMVEPFKVIKFGSIEIYPFALSHDAPNTVGYLLDDGKERLLYMTDTGYVNDNYLKFLKDLDHIIIESNHDVEMLMNTNRPLYVKRRIFSDSGHLCNEDCAKVLSKIISDRTKDVFLAHLSEEANTLDKAYKVNTEYLIDKEIDISHLNIVALKQFEIVCGGYL